MSASMIGCLKHLGHARREEVKGPWLAKEGVRSSLRSLLNKAERRATHVALTRVETKDEPLYEPLYEPPWFDYGGGLNLHSYSTQDDEDDYDEEESDEAWPYMADLAMESPCFERLNRKRFAARMQDEFQEEDHG